MTDPLLIEPALTAPVAPPNRRRGLAIGIVGLLVAAVCLTAGIGLVTPDQTTVSDAQAMAEVVGCAETFSAGANIVPAGGSAGHCRVQVDTYLLFATAPTASALSDWLQRVEAVQGFWTYEVRGVSADGTRFVALSFDSDQAIPTLLTRLAR